MGSPLESIVHMLYSIFIVFETQRPAEKPYPLKAFCQNVSHQVV